MRLQLWRALPRPRDFDTARDLGLSTNQPRSFKGEHHLVNRRRADAEVPLQVGFGGGRATKSLKA
jgi:hypothetical protein